MTTAQPGQEQRMVTDAMIEAGCAAMRKMSDEMLARERSKTPQDMPDYDEGDLCRVIFLAMHAARPTADLGEDGDADWLRNLVKLRFASERTDIGDRLERIADRLILYREALRELVYETTHGSPCEDDGSHKCTISGQALAKARAILSRSGG